MIKACVFYAVCGGRIFLPGHPHLHLFWLFIVLPALHHLNILNTYFSHNALRQGLLLTSPSKGKWLVSDAHIKRWKQAEPRWTQKRSAHGSCEMSCDDDWANSSFGHKKVTGEHLVLWQYRILYASMRSAWWGKLRLYCKILVCPGSTVYYGSIKPKPLDYSV